MSQPSLSCLTQQQNWIWLTLKALASSTCFRGKYPEAAPQSFLVLENNLLVELLFVCIYGRICPVSASDCLQLQKWILKKFSTAFSTIQKSAKNKLPIWSHCRLLSRGYVCLTAEKKQHNREHIVCIPHVVVAKARKVCHHLTIQCLALCNSTKAKCEQGEYCHAL